MLTGTDFQTVDCGRRLSLLCWVNILLVACSPRRVNRSPHAIQSCCSFARLTGGMPYHQPEMDSKRRLLDERRLTLEGGRLQSHPKHDETERQNLARNVPWNAERPDAHLNIAPACVASEGSHGAGLLLGGPGGAVVSRHGRTLRSS